MSAETATPPSRPSEAPPIPSLGPVFSLSGGGSPLAGKPWLKLAEPMLTRLLLIERINRKYEAIPKTGDGLSYLKNILATLRVDYEIAAGRLEDIPREGPLLVVANHPFGMIESFILAALLREVRPDVKVLANAMLAGVPEAREHIIPVDPFGTREAAVRNLVPMRRAIHWLKQGGALAMFPAGEVAHLFVTRRAVLDPEWNGSAATLQRQSGAAVLPVHFEGRNSAAFQLAGLVHPRLRTAMLPYELLNKQQSRIRVRIGKALPGKRLAAIDNRGRLTALLRFRTEMLRFTGESREEQVTDFGVVSAPKRPGRARSWFPARAVEEAQPAERLAAEVAALPAEQTLLEAAPYHVVHASAGQIPSLLREIGRLRELTFRATGEGTGKSIDLDRFDRHYRHLVLWNKEKREVAGAYRMGLMDRILAEHGEPGLYLSTLFRFKPGFLERIAPAVEMGRSFVREEYQRSFQPLHLLWKGIALFLAAHPRYRTLIGPVSISREYRPVSRQLMLRFLRERHGDPELARRVTARHAPRLWPALPGVGRRDPLPLENVDELSDLIATIEPELKGVPVLLRQYLRLGGRLLAFNVDARFSRVIDGLILVDMPAVDPRMWVKYVGAEKAAEYLAYHGVTASAGGPALDQAG